MSEFENSPHFRNAQKKAQQFVSRINLDFTLQLQISEHDGAWYLHEPWARVGLKAERVALRLPAYANKIDAYRVAVNKAIAGDYKILLLYTNSNYRPREKFPGVEGLRIMNCNLQDIEGRIARNMLLSMLGKLE